MRVNAEAIAARFQFHSSPIVGQYSFPDAGEIQGIEKFENVQAIKIMFVQKQFHVILVKVIHVRAMEVELPHPGQVNYSARIHAATRLRHCGKKTGTHRDIDDQDAIIGQVLV